VTTKYRLNKLKIGVKVKQSQGDNRQSSIKKKFKDMTHNPK